MRRNFIWITSLLLCSAVTSPAQRPAPSPPAERANPALPGQRPASNPQPQSPNQLSPLTNADVIQMVKRGTPEPAIIASIQTATVKFDLSRDGLQGLSRAGVSQNIQQAMFARGNGGAKSDELNPQPYPPKGKASAQGNGTQSETSFASIAANMQLVTTEEVKNPAASQSPMTARLRRQSQAGPVGPEQTLAAVGAGQSGATSSVASPSMSGTGASATPQTGHSGRHERLVNKCVSYNGLSGAITAVNGQAVPYLPAVVGVVGQAVVGAAFTSNVVFTPDLQYNHYIITGCGFGTQPGKIYLEGGFPAHGGKVMLYPYHAFGTPITPGWGSRWSDERIEAEIDPNVTGELDQDLLSLVIETATGGKAQGFGVGFYAFRGAPSLVSQIPSNAFCATETRTPSTCGAPGYVDQGGTLVSPCGHWGLNDCTVEVLRDGPAVHQGRADIDQYTINLKPGFVLYSASQQVAVLKHNGASSVGIAETYKAEIKGNQILVRQPIFIDPETKFVLSLYGLKIFVVGPAGVTDVWATGK